MPSKPEKYTISLTGPGITLKETVSKELAARITGIVMGIETPAQSAIPAGTGGTAMSRSSETTGLGTPKEFMARKKPATDVERVTCLAYYLLRERGTQEFKTIDLTKLNTEASQPKLSNPTFAARNAVNNQKFLALAGKGRKQITVRGEAVVEALPDRDAVKRALETHPLKKRRKTIKRKK